LLKGTRNQACLIGVFLRSTLRKEQVMATGKTSTTALLAFGAVALMATSQALAGPDFPSAVEQVLLAQKDGPVGQLGDDKKRALIACVNQVLNELPDGKKRFVVEAASFDEMEDRFGEVVMENRAEWKQRIAQGCAHIVV
jgi:hypothetical protein